MSADAIEAISALERQVLEPLFVGGKLRPTRPLGRQAFEIAEQAAAYELSGPLLGIRLRAARELCPIDSLPALGPGEWLLVCALNDLLQATNPSLTKWSSRYPNKLLDLVDEVVDGAGSCRTLADALCRHATFARAFDVVRVDSVVKWWVGQRPFYGSEPPPRLLTWQQLRRVSHSKWHTPLPAMAQVFPYRQRWEQSFAGWLEANPLLDLGTAAREAPQFRWTSAALGLLISPPGRKLALRRVLRAADVPKTLSALGAASADPHVDPGPVRDFMEDCSAMSQGLLPYSSGAPKSGE
jgi:hypothetical protein